MGSSSSFAQMWGTGSTATTVPTTTAGDVHIGGDIKGDRTSGVLGMFSNMSSSDGSGVEVFGNTHISFEGQIHYNSFHSTTATPLTNYGHVFQNYDATLGTPGWISQMGITKNGKVVISDMLMSTPTDVLTVKDNMGFWSAIDGQKNINGHAVNGFLGMYANTYSTDGSGVEVFGKNHPSFKGQVHYDSYHDLTSGLATGYGHIFQNYDATLGVPGWISQMGITKNGKVVISDNLITAPTDALTIKDNMGFWSATDGQKNINGHAVNGVLGMYANTYSTDGSGVEVFGKSHTSFNGSIHYDSYHDGTHPISSYGHVFQNYDATLSTPGWTAGMGITKNGKVVISDNLIAAPTDALTVKDNIGFWSATDGQKNINGHVSNGFLGMYANTFSNDGAAVEVYGNGGSSSFPGQVHLISNGTTGDGITLQTYNAGIYKRLMTVKNNGAVVISDGSIPTPNEGTPGGYNLYVQHGILTEKLKVANTTDGVNWSDFVFNKDYDLMALSDVETYVKKNKHLPEIPSAEEVAKEGIDVAAMDAKLLQKIEELTLYVIEQSKQINTQQKEIEKLKKKMN